MRNAYALLGILFVIVFVGAYLAVEQAQAPSMTDQTSSPHASSSPITSTSSEPHIMSLTLSSPAFSDNGIIPAKYTCDGDNVHPPLTISDVPEDTKSLVLVMDDPDIPQEIKQSRGIEKFDHWVIYNIPADTTSIPEGTTSGTESLNSTGDSGYAGPCPPTQYEPKEHRYIFRLYAMSGVLNFIKAPTLDEVETAAKGMSLGESTLIGRYQRPE